MFSIVRAAEELKSCESNRGIQHYLLAFYFCHNKSTHAEYSILNAIFLCSKTFNKSLSF